jgi:hypothetical protein
MLKTKRNLIIFSSTLLITFIFLLSLYFGWFDVFFYGADTFHTRGMDYFQIPRSYLNLLDGRSPYDTWGGRQFGPYTSWYVNHPAFALFIGSWFSFFSPWTSYTLFVIYSYGLMGICFYIIQNRIHSFLYKNFIFLILMCSFPTYAMLYGGNSQAHAVLSITLIIIGIYDLTYQIDQTKIKSAKLKIFFGLLISFFTKPIVILMLPMLLIEKKTRNYTLNSILVYIIISFLFIAIPLLNPQGIGFNKIFYLATHLDFVKENMNIFKNNFVVNEYMKDNSIHWFNIIILSDNKLMHIDIFSLPIFLDTLFGFDTPAFIYKIPIYFSIILSLLLFTIKDDRKRLEAIMIMIMIFTFSYLVFYNTVWEYQFTFALPIISMLFLLKDKSVFSKKSIIFLIFAGTFICLPSFYFLLRGSDFFIKDGYHLNQNLIANLIRIDKVVPAVIIFIILIVQLVIGIIKNFKYADDLQKYKV